MQKEIATALAAARKHKVRNEGERSSVELIVALLEDAGARVALLDSLSESYARQQNVRNAEAALAAAQAQA